MLLNLEQKSAMVVIPTTGSAFLRNAVESVISQTHLNTTCLVVIDGPEYEERSKLILKDYQSVKSMTLPWNIGANGWYGHRVYYMSAPLVNQDYWFALDQDNWFDPNHVRTTIESCEFFGWQWCYSLRRIHSSTGEFVCNDDCESLGKYPIFFNDQQHLVDTSTYCIRREVITAIAHAWYSGWGGDRRFYSAISQYFPHFGCTGQSTVCYRLNGNPTSVNADFFLNGNQIMSQRYPTGFPWRTRG